MKKVVVKKVLAGILSVGLLFSVAGCGKKSVDAAAKNSAVEKIKKSGKLVVGTSADYPPYEFHKSIDGKDQIVGFDIKIAEEIAKDMGVKLEIKDMKFDGLLAALDSGNVDMVIAGMTPTEERTKSVDFSKVYYNAIQGVAVKTENKDKLATMESLQGKTIGVQKGTVQESLVKEQLPQAKIKSLGKISDLVLELKNNKVDAIVAELPVINAYSQKNSDLAVTTVTMKSADSGSAVAVKKNSKEFVDEINKVLDKLAADKSIDKFVTDANAMAE